MVQIHPHDFQKSQDNIAESDALRTTLLSADDFFRDSGDKKEINVDLVDVDYDPLYGLSGWFDRALTRAQRDLLIRFPNPSYDLIEIGVKKDEGEEILSNLGNKKLFFELADLFQQEVTTS
jgi:hypothetical protein